MSRTKKTPAAIPQSSERRSTKPFPLFPLQKSAVLTAPLFAGDDNLLCYQRSLDGKSHIVRQSLVSGLSEVVTAEHSPAGTIGYGGGAFTCNGTMLVYAGSDRRLRTLQWESGEAKALTPAYDGLALPTISPCGRFIAYIAEQGSACHVYVVEASGKGLPLSLSPYAPWYAFNPCFSPDGKRLAWQEWDAPHMPWDESRLVVAELRCATQDAASVYELMPLTYKKLAKKGVSFACPQFSPDGRWLAYLQDGDGWRSLWITPAAADDAGVKIDTGPGEVGSPDWVPGLSHLRWHPKRPLLFGLRYYESQNHLFMVDLGRVSRHDALNTAPTETWPLAHTSIEGFTVGKETLAYVGSASDLPAQLITMPLQGRTPCLRATSQLGLIPTGSMSRPEFCSWKGKQGNDVYGIFYRCSQPPHQNADQPSKAPLIVHIHGGPTSQSLLSWRPEVHYFTSRGYHYLSVNHRGSSGFGRRYQDMLRGQWGVVDIDDARSGAKALVERGFAAADRLIIMGGSAGGYTVLRALTEQGDFWAAGISLYGISMLYELELNCHRFERHYNQALLGPLPAAGPLWAQRSPINAAGDVKAPLLLFHGTADKAVPYEQSVAFSQAVTNEGGICQLVTFQGEGHGFKKEENKKILYRTIDAFLQKYIVCQQKHGPADS